MELLQNILNAVNEVKVKDIKIYDTKTITPLFDAVIIATASSSRQAGAVINHLREAAHKEKFNVKGIEGTENSTWVLIDLEQVIVNIFIEEERERYGLDKLWKDLPQIFL